MSAARTPKKKCKTCHLTKIFSRGLCHRCYVAARATIDRGDATDDELVARGLLEPLKRAGRKAQSGFAKAFSKNGGK